MTRRQSIGWSMVAWVLLGLFWLVVTRDFHPTWTLATIVTATLMIVYATAAYMHHLYLIPNHWHAGRYGMHFGLLVTAMILLTGVALSIIRVSYLYVFGPYPVTDWYIDFAIDLFGMAVHVMLAAAVVSLYRRLVSKA